MSEKDHSVSPEQIPKEPPPNYEEAMAATGKIIKYYDIIIISV